jgi:acylphosphatase
VQNVGYRVFAHDSASRLGVGGHVRNLPDGTVQVVAEGSETALQALVRELERGPWAARVERVDCEWADLDPARVSPRFEVRA